MALATVVVAQSESHLLDAITDNLEEAGYSAFPTTDGVEAYEALEREDPDAVILDLNLRNVSGFRLISLLRNHPRWHKMPLIVATGYAFEEVEDLANLRIDGFVTRPFDPADLISKLEFALERSGKTRSAVA